MKRGYFMLIEASRIDHAAHAHDSGAHLWDTLEYNQVLDTVKNWIDNHPDTAMMSVADHETGGLTLPSGYDPRRLKDVKQSAEHLKSLWDKYGGDDRRGFLVSEILPAYALSDATDGEIEALLAGDFVANLAKFLNDRIGVEWSTGGHTAVDTVLYSYGAGKMGDELKKTLAGNWDNVDIPRFMEKALQVSLDEVTELLRAA
jgi:alkaline phosphatase